MRECWAEQLAARPALVDVVRRLQAMHAVPARQATKRHASASVAIMNPAYEGMTLTDASEL